MRNDEHMAEILTSAQVSRILRVSVPTVNRMARDGRLTALAKLPGLRGTNVFDRTDVDAYLRAEDEKWGAA